MNKIYSVMFIVLMAVFAFSAHAQASTEYNTSKLEKPEIPVTNYSEAPLGTLDALRVYVDSLIGAAEELIKFIDSIFEMLGMNDDSNVRELMEMYDSGMEMTGK